MQKIDRQVRQGDVLLIPVATIPEDATKVVRRKRVVLAEGEATGHCHAIDYVAKEMQVFSRNEEIYLRVKTPVVLRHQEHAPATIEPGEYLVRRQVEFFLDEVRNVAD